MKTNLITILTLALGLLVSSCSKDGDETEPISVITPDFYLSVDQGSIHDVFATDNQVYFFVYELEVPNDEASNRVMSFKKVAPNGTTTLMNRLVPIGNFTDNSGSFIITKKGTPICISAYENLVYTFNQDQTDVFTKEIPSLTTDSETRFSAIENLNDSTFVGFDKHARVLRAFNLSANERSYALGNIENNDIIDGIGEDAGFRYISKITRHNDMLYVIDDDSYLRAIEHTKEGLKVTTIADSKGLGDITDIAFDKVNNELIASINGSISSKPGGLYVLDMESNTFKELVTDRLTLDLSNIDGIEITEPYDLGKWGRIDHIQVVANDLYFLKSRRFLKISDYRTKIK